jgi:hypothetical protein
MPERTPPEGSQIHFTEIKVDPKEARYLLDRYLTATTVLTTRISPKHLRSRARRIPVPEIKVSAQTNWRDVGQALRAEFLERACNPCRCYYCCTHRTKRGQREKRWVDAVLAAVMDDPSELVKLLKTSAFTKSDRSILAQLLDAVFGGEIDDA